LSSCGLLSGFEAAEAEAGLGDNPLLRKRPAAGPKRCCIPSPLPPRGTTPWEEYRAFEPDSPVARRSVGEAAGPRTTDDCCAATDADARWWCARTAIVGNSRTCSREARDESVREAGRRYQQTEQGRRNHARRQKLYRFRLAEQRGVTHQGSPGRRSCRTVAPWLLRHRVAPSISNLRTSKSHHPCCSFCGKTVEGGFLRSDFRRRRGGVRDPARGRC